MLSGRGDEFRFGDFDFLCLCRRIEGGELTDPVGAFTIEGRVADLLGAVEGIGGEPRETGAGWCAKGRRRVPVWATTPALRLSHARIEP